MHAHTHSSTQALLEPTVIYVKRVVALHAKVGLKGLVHITGGGMTENIPRVIPKGMGVAVDPNSYKVGGSYKLQACVLACAARSTPPIIHHLSNPFRLHVVNGPPCGDTLPDPLDAPSPLSYTRRSPSCSSGFNPRVVFPQRTCAAPSTWGWA